jgi:regulator of CtrA degradation
MDDDGTSAARPVRLLQIDALHVEALHLAQATSAYLARGTRGSAPDPVSELVITCETTRLVSRLGFCLAWLLGRRAVLNGELGAAEAKDARWRLGGHDVVSSADAASSDLVPAHLRALITRGDNLYQRIDRLDRLLDSRPQPTAAEPPSL